MIIKSIIIFLLTIPQTLLASNSFADYFEYESSFTPVHGDEITQFFTENDSLSSKKRIAIFKEFNDAISEQINNAPDKAVLWFSKGLNFKNRLSALEEQKKLGARNIDPVIKQTKEYMQKSFLKAIQLDDEKKPKLTVRMFGTMKNNLVENNRILALQKELSLGGSGDNESHYWFSHWDVIGSLQDEGRFDEAELALYTLKNELKSSGLEDSEFTQVYQQAMSNLAQDHSLSPKLEDEETKKYNAKGSPKITPSKPLFESIVSKLETYWFMIIINLFVFISLILAFLKREKD